MTGNFKRSTNDSLRLIAEHIAYSQEIVNSDIRKAAIDLLVDLELGGVYPPYWIRHYDKYLSVTLRDLQIIHGHFRRNRKIQVIKYIRSITGLGLKDAKDILDSVSFMALPSNVPDIDDNPPPFGQPVLSKTSHTTETY